ncbi:PVC-type heme-binding CxxCH protein [Roseimaritima ulvae]|uniref:Cytochrome c n=1 Tax=Roseimaritima ulvae TaxID=980254 RepID=A0A5B9QLD3_9BACT|nr:PVC-type heme-binding CxxCH protein [Roseimaritima ulvae]QEG38390.1 Cytochrome c [Roseimaritima ulvae]
MLLFRSITLGLLGFVLVSLRLNAQSPGSSADSDQPLPPATAAATMRVPDGFSVTLFAGEPEVRQPIGFCLDDRARLWVAEAYNYPVKTNEAGDRIVILEDSDGDGRHDKRSVFFDGLNYVTGIEVGFGGVWVMSPPNLYFFADADGDDVPDGPPTVILDGFGTHANAHNLANGLAWGPDGWLYGTHGRTNWSMIGKPGTPDAQRTRFDGGVYRYHPVRKIWEPYADGTTNPWGIDWNDYGHAFVCNCVNPHLFQVIQGAHYEPWRGRASSRYAYERIDTIADHLHFVGLANPRNGLGSEAEDSAGGGHSHCGTLIYLADDFPPRYRNQLLTNNIHGKRINNDLLRRDGSGYVASHGPDFMRAADPWFVGVTLAQGPAGEIYVSDWSDTGECHHTRNTQRQTGRIFRVRYGEGPREPVAIAELSDSQLVQLQWHRNDWFVRHGRRVLQERAAAGVDLAAALQPLRTGLINDPDVTRRLRAMWALHACDALPRQTLIALLDDEDENIRAWAVTLLCEQPPISAPLAADLLRLASDDPSPLVRLSLASALQRLDLPVRWPIAEALAAHGEDAGDANLPLMIWYAAEPLIDDDLQRFARLAVSAALPKVRQHAARRIASASNSQTGMNLLVEGLADEAVSAAQRTDVLQGMLVGLEGRRRVDMPASWPAVYRRLVSLEDAALLESLNRLALRFGDPAAIEVLQRQAANPSLPAVVRQRAITALTNIRTQEFDSQLLELLDDPTVRAAALRGLAVYTDEQIGQEILERFEGLDNDEKTTALQTLATRVAWARQLVTSIEQGRIATKNLNAFTARQLHQLNDAQLSARLERVWGNVQPTSQQLTKQVARYKSWLVPSVIAQADRQHGQQLFQQHCANCHRFFGKGGAIGPDLSGAQRTNLDYLLENIVAPSLTVSKDFQMHVVVTTDGRVLTGLLESESDDVLTLLTASERITLPQDEIESHELSKNSMMPTGLLEPLSDQDIRDLMGYLQQ